MKIRGEDTITYETQDAEIKTLPLRQAYLSFSIPLGNFRLHLC